ncbi:MAG: type I restriction enzyme HsdR N-terminal domain-containing protein, partial [Flavobacteriaceae bacterium]
MPLITLSFTILAITCLCGSGKLLKISQALASHKEVPKSLLNVEKKIEVNGISKRYDIIVYSPQGTVLLLVECKAAKVEISQNTFDQIARYNRAAQSHFLMVTNGINHYFCDMTQSHSRYHFLEDLPPFK